MAERTTDVEVMNPGPAIGAEPAAAGAAVDVEVVNPPAEDAGPEPRTGDDGDQIIDPNADALGPPDGEPLDATAAAAAAEARARDEQTGRFTRRKKHVPAERRVAEAEARIGEATRRRHEAERLAKAEERRLLELRAQREALERPKAKTFDKPRPEWNDGEGWADYGVFQKARDEWSDARDAWRDEQYAAQVRAAVDARTRETMAYATEQGINQQIQERVATARTKYPDYADADKAAGDLTIEIAGEDGDVFFTDLIRYRADQADELIYHFGTHLDELEAFLQMPRSNAMMQALRESKNPVALASYLATHEDEAERIYAFGKAGHASALWALASIDSSLSGAQAGSPSKVAPISKAAPPPGHRAGSRSAGTAKPLHELPPDDYHAARLEQQRKEKLARFGISA